MDKVYFRIFLAILMAITNPVGADSPRRLQSDLAAAINPADLAPAKFGTPFIRDATGRQILYDGTSVNGRVGVFRYVGTEAKYIQGGYISDNLATPTAKDIVWNRQNQTAEQFHRQFNGATLPTKPGVRSVVAASPSSFVLNTDPAVTGKFFEIYATNDRGIKFYYQGRTDSLGRTLVFKLNPTKINGRQMVRVGTVLQGQGANSAPRISWNGGEFLDKLQANAGVSSSMIPASNSGAGSGAIASSSAANNTSPPVQNYPRPSSPAIGSIVRGVKGTTQTFFYMQEIDAKTGLQRVWTYKPSANGGIGTDYKVGLLRADGTVIDLKTFTPEGAGSKAATTTASTSVAATARTSNLPAVTNGVTYDANAGAGASEINSPQSVRMYYRPSNMQRALGWSKQQVSNFKARIYRLIDGPTFSPLDAEPAEKMTDLSKVDMKSPSALKDVAQGVGAFYAVMGAVAFFKLVTNFPNNPMIFQQWMDSVSVGQILMIGTFIRFAMPFMTKVRGFGTAKDTILTIPVYAAISMVGTVLMSVIQVVAFDPDSGLCLGIGKFSLTPWDLQACDRLKDRYFNEEMATTIVPQLARALPDAMFYGGAFFAFNATNIATVLSRVPLLEGASPSAIGVAQVILGTALFFGSRWLTDTALQVQQKITGLMVAKPAKEDAVFNGWAAMRSKIANEPAEPEVQAFKTALDKYASMMVRWRVAQSEAMNEAYTQWTAKVLRYHSEINAAYDLYSDFIGRINWEKTTVGASEFDARAFNATNIRNLEKWRMTGLNKGASMVSGWEATRGLDKDTLVFGDPILSQQYQNDTWKHIYNRNFFDFAVTSMACGPEVEGMGSTGIMYKIKSVYRKYVNGNSTPSQVVGRQSGRELRFYPPKIVNAIDQEGSNVCLYLPGNTPGPNLEELVTTIFYYPEEFPILPWSFSGRKSYRGLYAYIKDNVRPSILFDGTNNFESWWQDSVGTTVEQEETQIRADYEKMLKSLYLPALQNSDYYWCGARDVSKASFYGSWAKLRGGSGGACGSGQMHRLAKGILPSLQDELRLYLAMIVDLSSKASPGTPATEDPVLVAARNLMTAYESYASNSTVIDGKVRPDIQAIAQNVMTLGQTFRATFSDASKNPGGVYTPAQTLALDIFDRRIVPVMDQTQVYYDILVRFEASAE